MDALFKPRSTPPRKKTLLPLFYSAFFFITGCAGPLIYSYDPKPPEHITKLREPVTVLVDVFADKRASASLDERGRRKIGNVTVTVSDMSDTEIVLSEDISQIVSAAFMKELIWAGYTAKTPAGAQKDADYILSGEVKEFSLDIGNRDKIAIVLNVNLVDGKTGKTVWSDEEAYKNDRYAGSSGNSRLSISKYISSSLSQPVRKTIQEAAQTIAYARVAPPAAKEAATATGKLIITTNPTRGKVYLNEIYYGLTPMNAEIEQGVYELTLKLDGFKNAKEKISVRKGQTTELELKLEKE